MRARGGGWSGTPPPRRHLEKILPRQAREFFCLWRFVPNLFFGFPDIRDREEVGGHPTSQRGNPPSLLAPRRSAEFFWPLAKRHMRAAAGGHVRRVSEHPRHGCYLGPYARSNQPRFSSPTRPFGLIFLQGVFPFPLKIRFCTYLATRS